MDLRPYGIGLTLRKGIDVELLTGIPINTGTFSRSNGLFTFFSGEYTMGALLGKGTYGESFEVKHRDTNAVSIVKVIHIRTDRYREDTLNLLKECMIHILLERASESQTNGPFVPRFYEVALDAARGLMLIRMEKMYGTLADLYEQADRKHNEIYVPDTLKQLATIMGFFFKTLRFNHRDMKSNNVMYTKTHDGRIFVKLIDFGFTCLTWEGVRIAGSTYFSLTDKCFIPSRDLTQFVYEVQLTFGVRVLSPRTMTFLHSLLTFKLNGGRECRLHKGCKKGSVAVKRWLDIYDFLNNPTIHNPNCVPEELVRLCDVELGLKPTPAKAAIKVIGTPVDPTTKLCPPDKILNPQTRRCVKRDGPLGKRLMLASEKSTGSPKATRRRQRKATADLKPCKPGMTRNPLTRRCRKRSATTVKVAVGKKSCPAGKILNPATRRCVKRDGAVGRRLVF
jgi:serine/threonine protein kinase